MNFRENSTINTALYPGHPARRRLPRALRRIITGLLIAYLYACSSATGTLPPLPADARILAFGDSLTWGTGAPREQSYPAVLERLSGRNVINAGVPGEVTGQGLARLAALLDEHRPQLLILCHGGNDMLRKKPLDAAADNLRGMIRLAQERGVPVVLLGVPKPGVFLSSAEFYAQIARELRVPYEGEILADVLSERALKSDAIHPNGAGYEKIAAAIHGLLRDAGAL